MKLDIGCGNNPIGDVNLDVSIDRSLHRDNAIIEIKKVPNFIKGDINFLPFRDNAFTEIFCYHVIEHRGVNPNRAIEEMIRVAIKRVDIKLPPTLILYIQKLFHLHDHHNVLTTAYFHCILQKFAHIVEVRRGLVRTNWGGKLLTCVSLPIYIPLELRVTIFLT